MIDLPLFSSNQRPEIHPGLEKTRTTGADAMPCGESGKPLIPVMHIYNDRRSIIRHPLGPPSPIMCLKIDLFNRSWCPISEISLLVAEFSVLLLRTCCVSEGPFSFGFFIVRTDVSTVCIVPNSSRSIWSLGIKNTEKN